jgi:hypothetical protein
MLVQRLSQLLMHRLFLSLKTIHIVFFIRLLSSFIRRIISLLIFSYHLTLQIFVILDLLRTSRIFGIFYV